MYALLGLRVGPSDFTSLNVKVCFITAGEINMAAAREVHLLKRCTNK